MIKTGEPTEIDQKLEEAARRAHLAKQEIDHQIVEHREVVERLADEVVEFLNRKRANQ